MTFKSRGIRALVILQMDEMRQLFAVWKRAKRAGVQLPSTRDPAYQDLDALMRHPLRACRGYLTWLCETLRRPDPGVPDPPEPSQIASKGLAYLDVLDAAWRTHTAWMSDRVLYSKKVHVSRWGHPMTVEGMLEHAVAHPMRHRFQLEELMQRKVRMAKRAPKSKKRTAFP